MKQNNERVNKALLVCVLSGNNTKFLLMHILQKNISFGILLQRLTAIGEGREQLFSMRNASASSSLWVSIPICMYPA